MPFFTNRMDKLNEKIIEKALRLRDEGKKDAEILNIFADQRDELKDILDLVAWIESEKVDVVPPRSELTKLLAKLKTEPKMLPVEEIAPVPVPVEVKRKGVPSPFAGVWKIAAPVFAVVVLLVLSLHRGGLTPSPTLSPSESPNVAIETPQKFTATNLAAPTGNLDSVILALNQEADNEVALLSQTDADTSNIDSDLQMSDFSQLNDQYNAI